LRSIANGSPTLGDARLSSSRRDVSRALAVVSSGSRRIDTGAVGASLLALAAALVAGVALFHESTSIALALCALPLVVWLFGRPTPALALLGVSIPFVYSLTGGRGGVNLAASDLLLLFVAAGMAFDAALTGSLPAWRALRPVARPVTQYGFLMLVVLVFHLSVSGVAKTGQRFELFLLPMLVGAFAALTERHVALLKAYVVGATALAVLWPFAHGLGQKNPTGQMIANAILLLIGYRPLRRYALCVLGLVPGLVFTGSRGAILALVVGLIVILAFQRSRSGAMLGRVAVVLVLSFAVYSTLPVSLQTRLTTLTPGVGSPGAYSLYVRSQYARDAEQIIKAHPWVGIGVGNYLAGNSLNGTQAQDPHDVLLLQAAEGGYLLAASFVVLIALVVLALKRMREVDVAAAAAGVMVATVAHGLVDVYWVRGTPMLSWLLVGMVCGGLMRSREQPEAPAS
jgi:hypothetical protein